MRTQRHLLSVFLKQGNGYMINSGRFFHGNNSYH